METEIDPVLKMFVTALRKEWDYCGGDILANVSTEFTPRGEPMGSMSRDDVFEVTSDLYFGGLSHLSEEYTLWKCLTEADMEILKKIAFPFEEYGY